MRRLRRWLGFADIVSARDNTGAVRIGHVTAWACRRDHYVEGDPCPHLPGGSSTYSVRTREGWYVNVDSGRIKGWTKKPIHTTSIR